MKYALVCFFVIVAMVCMYAGAQTLPSSVTSLLQGLSTPTPTTMNTPQDMPSLFFTDWEKKALDDALRIRGMRLTRIDPQQQAGTFAPTKTEPDAPKEPPPPPPPREREVRMGDLVYVSGDNWIVWINETPFRPKGAIPKDAISMKVTKEYVEVEWLDAYTNQIFPLRLHPHERFNFDMRVFIPGTGNS